jgi:hypothetical protein
MHLNFHKLLWKAVEDIVGGDLALRAQLRKSSRNPTLFHPSVLESLLLFSSLIPTLSRCGHSLSPLRSFFSLRPCPDLATPVLLNATVTVSPIRLLFFGPATPPTLSMISHLP